MERTIEQYGIDEKSYRQAHGDRALFVVESRRTRVLCIVKRSSASEVVLAPVFKGVEKTISRQQFDAEWHFWVQDESVFVFGTDEAKKAAHAMHKAQSDAVQTLIYGLPITITFPEGVAYSLPRA